MTDVIVKVMVEVLNVLSIATKEIKQYRASESIPGDRSSFSAYCYLATFLKKLVGRTDIEDALLRLEVATLEEARLAATESLKATNVQDTLKAMEDRMRAMEGILQGAGSRSQDVDDKGKNIGDNAINSEQTVTISVVITDLIVNVDRC